MSGFEQSPTNSTGKRRAGCENCRLRHLKCDGQESCAQCTKRGQPCVRGTRIRFRYNDNPGIGRGQYDFADDQQWIKTTHKRIRFVDESEEVSAFYEGDAGSAGDEDQSAVVPAPSPSLIGSITKDQTVSSPGAHSDLGTYLHRARKTKASKSFSSTFSYTSSCLSAQREYPPPWPETPTTTTNEPPAPSPQSEPLRQRSVSFTVGPSHSSHLPHLFPLPPPLPSICSDAPHRFSFSSLLESPAPYLQNPPLPLKNAQEAELMRHFVVDLAPAFDIGEHEQTFATHVAQTATVCQPLLKAIMAVSAESMKSSNNYLDAQERQQLDELTRYRDEYMYLIPGPNSLMDDETQLAAAVLMRHLTNVQVPIVSEGIGMSSSSTQPSSLAPLLNSMTPPPYNLSTHAAQDHPTYWASLRQEIYLAIMNQRLATPLAPGTLLSFERSLGTHLASPGSLHDFDFKLDEDDIWAKRITLHLVDVVHYCFGDGDRSATVHASLVDYIEAWMKSKPATFDPIFIQERPEDDPDTMFPEVILLNHSVMLGLQYYYLSRMLLIAVDPSIPRLGFEQRAAMRSMDEKLRADVRMVCGIANSLSEMNPAHIAASMAIALAGDRFENRAEQHVLLDMLDRTKRQYGWSTSAENLKKAWGLY